MSGPPVQQLKKFLDELSVPRDVKFYEGASHSFMTDTGKETFKRMMRPLFAVEYNPEAAEDALRRIFAFFNTYIRRTKKDGP